MLKTKISLKKFKLLGTKQKKSSKIIKKAKYTINGKNLIKNPEIMFIIFLVFTKYNVFYLLKLKTFYFFFNIIFKLI